MIEVPMIEVPITDADFNEAKEKAENLGKLKNSIRKGEGNITGFLGEIAANKVIKGKIVSDTSYDFDILKEEVSWEVKTKSRSVKPKPDYNCSVAEYNTKQKCDRYIFVSLWPIEKPTKAYILGYLTKDEFYKKAFFLKKGQIEPGTPWRVKASCYNVKVSELNQMESK
jgi:hypothetical protein